MTDLNPVGERGGAAAVEAAILAVVLALVIAFVIAAGRVAAAEAATDHAARAAARSVSIARAPDRARHAATEEAARVLEEEGLVCAALSVDIETETGADEASGRDRAYVVRVHVVCTVRWSDLGVVGVPGRHDVRADFSSPIDRYRELP